MTRPTIGTNNPVRDLVTVAALTLLLAFGYVQSIRASEAYGLAERANGERDALQAQLDLLQADHDTLTARLQQLTGEGATSNVTTDQVEWANIVASPSPAGSWSNVDVWGMQDALRAGALVLDVREASEYQEGHVAGTTLVPLATLSERAQAFDTSAPIYVFCRSGNRSEAAARTLVAAGFTDVRNIEGGMNAWQAANLPVAR